MKVLVVGAGNIGTTLANILLAHQRELGIEEVLVQKVREPAPFDAPELERARSGVARGCPGHDRGRPRRIFSASVGLRVRLPKGRRRDPRSASHLDLPGLRGVGAGERDRVRRAVRRGCEPGAVVGARLVQIASCNTHATATLLAALGGPGLARSTRRIWSASAGARISAAASGWSAPAS